MDGSAALRVEDVPLLKLVQLRSALEARGLSAEGSKGELIERLQQALQSSDDGASAPSAKRQRVEQRAGSDSSDDDNVGPRLPSSSATESNRAATATSSSADDDDEDDVGPKVPLGYDGAGGGDDSDGDDVGPAIPSSIAAAATNSDSKPAAKATAAKKRELPGEAAYLSALPNAGMYERSYMHRSPITQVVVTPSTDFVVTASADGVLKFWKKLPKEIEFVKTYRAHLEAIAGVVSSADGLRLASIGDDGYLKTFDVQNFDMTDMARLPFQVGSFLVL